MYCCMCICVLLHYLVFFIVVSALFGVLCEKRCGVNALNAICVRKIVTIVFAVVVAAIVAVKIIHILLFFSNFPNQ